MRHWCSLNQVEEWPSSALDWCCLHEELVIYMLTAINMCLHGTHELSRFLETLCWESASEQSASYHFRLTCCNNYNEHFITSHLHIDMSMHTSNCSLKPVTPLPATTLFSLLTLVIMSCALNAVSPHVINSSNASWINMYCACVWYYCTYTTCMCLPHYKHTHTHAHYTYTIPVSEPWRLVSYACYTQTRTH